MKIIVKNAEELRDPFLCFCLLMKFEKVLGQDYIACNPDIVNPFDLAMEMFSVQDISYESFKTIDTLYRNNSLTLEYVFDVAFPMTNTCGILSNAKMYYILAKYITSKKQIRKNLYNSVNDEVKCFDSNIFPKNKDGISLACIISNDELVKHPEYIDYECLEIYNINELSLKDLYNICSELSIEIIERLDELGYEDTEEDEYEEYADFDEDDVQEDY